MAGFLGISRLQQLATLNGKGEIVTFAADARGSLTHALGN